MVFNIYTYFVFIFLNIVMNNYLEIFLNIIHSFKFPWSIPFSELIFSFASVINGELTHISSLACED